MNGTGSFYLTHPFLITMSLRIFSALVLSGCLLPLAAAGEAYLYEGQITFKILTGKDCGVLKAGDSLAIKLAIRTQENGLSGYSRLQGNDPVSLKGQDEANLTLRSADPADAGGHSLALAGVGLNSLTGHLMERTLTPDQPGCNLTLGEITAHLSRTGSEANAQLQKTDAEFRAARYEHEARIHEPEAHAELMRLLPEAFAAAAPERNEASAALTLFERMQPLYDKVYGRSSEKSLDNLALLASILTRLAEYGRAAAIWRDLLDQARKGYPDRVANAAYNLGDALEQSGDRAAALTAFEEARRADEARFGLDHSEVAESLTREIALLQGLRRHLDSLPLLKRLLAIRERTLGSDHPRTAGARSDLAWAYHHAGQDELALSLAERAIASLEIALGPEHRDTALALNHQALILRAMGRFAEALPLQQRALAIHERADGPEHGNTSANLINLADLHLAMAAYEKALPLYQRALAVREKTLGLVHPDTASSAGNLAYLYKVTGRYEDALPLYQRALSIDEKALGPGHPDTATDLNNLASLHATLGNYDQALKLHLRALAIREKSLGPEHLDTRNSLNNLTVLYQEMGEYEKAMPYAVRALAIAERGHGPTHPNTAGSLTNLALLLGELGQYDKAIELAQRALAINENALGAIHPLTATALDNLAIYHSRLGQYAKALPLTQRALAIREKSLGDDHIDTATSLNNLGTLHWRMGDYEQAAAYSRRSLAIRERKQGTDHPETATVLNNLAMDQLELGRHDEAAALLRRVLKNRRQTLGEGHKLTGYSLTNLGFAEAAGQRYADALAAFVEANAVTAKVIEQVFALAGEKDKLAYVQQQEWGYFGELSLIHRHFSHDQRALHMGLDLVLARKGIVFDAQARQNEALAGSLDAEARAMWEELVRLRTQQSQLLQSKPVATRAEDYLQQQRQIEAQIGKIELALSSRSALVAEQLKQRNLTSAAVAANLPTGGVLAEFIKIDDYDWTRNRWTGSKRYLAFLLHPDKRIDLIDLGDADTLENALREPLRQLDRIGLDNELQLAAARKLHQILWQPLEQTAGQAESVIFSPDGVLNLVPFAAMLDTDGRFFIERRTPVYVTSGREIARGDTGTQPDSLLYLAANPDFNRDAPSGGQGGATTRSDGFNLRFDALPGTQEEADFIPVLLPGKQRIVTGRNATESSVLGAGRPRVMHLATHGFFLADQMHASAGTRGAMALEPDVPVPVAASSVRQENPLLRSGLALAGANQASQASGGDDGLLTALEVSGMSLHGTDLVTLSACETGRGDVQSGEGVFGLRRAFALSGARHLVMSLWPVGDEATAQQMRVFYRQYGSGVRPAEALRAAQLVSIEALRAQGKVAEPALWAPFIAQGW